MTDTETAPDFTPIKRPGRVPIAAPPAVPEQPVEPGEPPTETGAAREANTAASVAPPVEAAAESAPAAETPVTPTQRGKRDASTAAVTVPWESALPGVTSADIRAELLRRERHVPKLMAERAVVIQQMEAIEEALASIGEDLPEFEAVPAPRAPKAPRARNAVSLRDAIAAAVQVGATVTPAEATKAVRASGYTSTAANLAQMVASTLAKDSRFQREGRGQYRRLGS